MSRSKTGTPAAENHPAHTLKYVDDEIKQQLLKTPTHLAIEQDSYRNQLRELRNDWRYAFVIQWITYFRGAIRLANDAFTIDLVEEELVGLVEENIMPKVAQNMASVLLGTKVTPEDFSFRVRHLLGDLTSVLGTEEDPVDYDAVSSVDKFEVIYLMITFLEYNDAFRRQVEKYDRQQELRFDPIFDDGADSYFLLSDNRIYKRNLVSFPEINVPRKYKRAKLLNPEVDFAEIEPVVKWECVAIGVYQLNDFLESIKGKHHFRPLFKILKEIMNELASDDLETRKKVMKRKKEQQLHDLVSHRKRSSRLQHKEELDKIEKQKEDEELERQREITAKARAQKRYKLKIKQLENDAVERLKRQTASRRAALLEEYKPSSTGDIELGEGDWLFDCYCGLREKNYDDGVKLLKCERCNRWQHLKCQDRAVRQELVRNADEVFICLWCQEEIERSMAKKLDDERIQREKEAEEKIRQRELQKRREFENRIKWEKQELERREEMERERERRSLERSKEHTSSPPVEKTNATGAYPSSEPHCQQQAQPVLHPSANTKFSHGPAMLNGPALGTFQPQSMQFPPHQQFYPQYGQRLQYDQPPQLPPLQQDQQQQQQLQQPSHFQFSPQQFAMHIPQPSSGPQPSPQNGHVQYQHPPA